MLFSKPAGIQTIRPSTACNWVRCPSGPNRRQGHLWNNVLLIIAFPERTPGLHCPEESLSMVSPPHLLPVSVLVSKRKKVAWSDGGPGPFRLVEEVMVHTCCKGCVSAVSLLANKGVFGAGLG